MPKGDTASRSHFWNAYNCGYQAYREGKKLSANPFQNEELVDAGAKAGTMPVQPARREEGHLTAPGENDEGAFNSRRALSGVSVVAFATWVHAETSTLLQSLPRSARKSIEDTRAECKELGENSQPSGDVGLVTFTLDGKQAVLIDPMLLCNGCHAGFNCTNRGTRDVELYVRRQKSWARVLSDGNITGEIFISTKPGAYKEIGQELNALVVNLYIGNRECPTREAASSAEQSYEARSCVLRWSGSRFTYKPL